VGSLFSKVFHQLLARLQNFCPLKPIVWMIEHDEWKLYDNHIIGSRSHVCYNSIPFMFLATFPSVVLPLFLCGGSSVLNWLWLIQILICLQALWILTWGSRNSQNGWHDSVPNELHLHLLTLIKDDWLSQVSDCKAFSPCFFWTMAEP
jgi:hypothetical protein